MFKVTVWNNQSVSQSFFINFEHYSSFWVKYIVLCEGQLNFNMYYIVNPILSIKNDPPHPCRSHGRRPRYIILNCYELNFFKNKHSNITNSFEEFCGQYLFNMWFFNTINYIPVTKLQYVRIVMINCMTNNSD